MRAVVQRVSHANVVVNNEAVSSINKGLLVLLGVETGDSDEDIRYMVQKIRYARIFEDEQDKMNLDVAQVNGAILLVSQFTLLGDARKGRRPSYTGAARPEIADELYEKVADGLRQEGLSVATGQFRTHMEVTLCNDGPVTLLLDSRKTF